MSDEAVPVIYIASFDVRAASYDELKRWVRDTHLRELVEGGFRSAASYESVADRLRIADVYALSSLRDFDSAAYRGVNPASGHPRRGTQSTNHTNTTYRIVAERDFPVTVMPSFVSFVHVHASPGGPAASTAFQIVAAIGDADPANVSGVRVLNRFGRHPHYVSHLPEMLIMIGWRAGSTGHARTEGLRRLVADIDAARIGTTEHADTFRKDAEEQGAR